MNEQERDVLGLQGRLVMESNLEGHNQYTVAASKAESASEEAEKKTLGTRAGKVSHKDAAYAHRKAAALHDEASSLAAKAGLYDAAEEHSNQEIDHTEIAKDHESRM